MTEVFRFDSEDDSETVLIKVARDGRFQVYLRDPYRFYWSERAAYTVWMERADLIGLRGALSNGGEGIFGISNFWYTSTIKVKPPWPATKSRRIRVFNRRLIAGQIFWTEISGSAIDALSSFVAECFRGTAALAEASIA